MEQYRYSRLKSIILPFLIFLGWLGLFVPARGQAEDTYRFQRMWPALSQPWYFYPKSIAIDKQGNIYVADSLNYRILKFTSEGEFITRWGKEGSGNRQFESLDGMAVDSSGNVYVVDSSNHRIQKFTSEGEYITKWGGYGRGKGRFIYPDGVAVDGTGNVYVADRGNHRIQKFTPQGGFITQWGSEGKRRGRFKWPSGMAIDGGGNVYVADSGNHRIQKFTSEGEYLTEWEIKGRRSDRPMPSDRMSIDGGGNVYVADSNNYRVLKFTSEGKLISRWGSGGVGDDQFGWLTGIAIDGSGLVYVADGPNHRIQKFSSEGAFITKWGSKGSGEGQFRWPADVAADGGGHVYVADMDNHRIQKFTLQGELITQWGSKGGGDGQFVHPYGIALDGGGHVYVSDVHNGRIQKFTSEGEYITQWRMRGTGPDQFVQPAGLAVDGSGSVYVLDTGNHRILKFTSEGQFIGQWGSAGKNTGWLTWPSGMVIDGSGHVYVADSLHHCVRKFTGDGTLITQWGTEGRGDGQFSSPAEMATDAKGNVFVADFGNHRIQKFSSEGKFLAKWGAFGSGPGQLIFPRGIAISADGNCYVSDGDNNRIQVFMPVAQDTASKAIIVAGGGPYPGNHLWDATQRCANFAYRTLTYQGIPSENIRYLSANTRLDLDNDGAPDVFAKPTNEALEQSIRTWAKGAETLILYLTDHGGEGRFILSGGGEILLVEDLDRWLDRISETRLILIYDACKSGSFLSPLASSESGQERVLLASTNETEQAFFGNLGSLSFSSFFWSQVFNGSGLFESFDLAEEAIRMSLGTQHPMVEADGDGVAGQEGDWDALERISSEGIFHGSSTFNTAPSIGSVLISLSSENPSKVFFAAEGVEDEEGDNISRVWVVIRPPGYKSRGGGAPVNDLPYVNLARVEGSDRYEGSYGGFNRSGVYQVAFYAMDGMCNVSVPKVERVPIESPLTHKAILVAGWSEKEEMRRAIEFNVKFASRALKAQGYQEKDVLVLRSPEGARGVPADGSATLESLREAIENWAVENTQDLVLYLTGEGNKGHFQLNEEESLSGAALSEMLDSHQRRREGSADVLLLYDACLSGSFLSLLQAPEGKKRILLASATAGQNACFLLEGIVSFSQFFWTQVLSGANVRDAFTEAYDAINRASGILKQEPQLDDNGNGEGNDPTEGQVARLFRVGSGIVSAGEAPVICGNCLDVIDDHGRSATIRVQNITTTREIEKVWAVVIPPDFSPGSAQDPVTDLPTLELDKTGEGIYQGTYRGFKEPGDYEVSVYAVDSEGNVSLPRQITVSR